MEIRRWRTRRSKTRKAGKKGEKRQGTPKEKRRA